MSDGKECYGRLQVYASVKSEDMRKPTGTPGTVGIDVIEFVLGMAYAEEEIRYLRAGKSALFAQAESLRKRLAAVGALLDNYDAQPVSHRPHAPEIIAQLRDALEDCNE